jgi:hypothetical protein
LAGMGSAWYIIWSSDLLFIQDPRTFERLRGPCYTKGWRNQRDLQMAADSEAIYTLSRLLDLGFSHQCKGIRLATWATPRVYTTVAIAK